MQFSVDLIISNRHLLRKKIGYGINNFYYDSITNAVYYIESEIKGLGKAITDRIMEDPDFIHRDIKDCYKRGEILLKTSEAFKKETVDAYSKKELFDKLHDFREKYLQVLPYMTYPHSIERYIIGSIRKELESALCTTNKKAEIERIYHILTTPTRLDMEQQIDLYRAAYDVQRNTSHTFKRAQELQEKYGWLPLWSVTAQPLKTAYYEKEILNLSKQDIDYPNEITKLKNNELDLQKKLKETLDVIQASKILRRYIYFLQEYIYLRGYRRNIISHAHYNHLPLLKAIGRRTGIGKTVLYMSYQEMLDLLQNKLTNPEEIKKRKNGYAVYEKDGCLEIIVGSNKIKKLLGEVDKDYNSNTSQPAFVKGRVASRGNVRGKACVVMSIQEIGKVKKGVILVTPMTTPDFTPILRKISAIVTNEGGVICHAAIVSREFKIPCIVGTCNATEIFKDGDLLEVDAENGICRKIV